MRIMIAISGIFTHVQDTTPREYEYRRSLGQPHYANSRGRYSEMDTKQLTTQNNSRVTAVGVPLGLPPTMVSKREPIYSVADPKPAKNPSSQSKEHLVNEYDEDQITSGPDAGMLTIIYL